MKYSFNDVKNNKIYRRFKKNFRVRRNYVKIRLKYLIEYHFDYNKFNIDVDKLLQLFINDSIFKQLTTHEKLNKNVDLDEKN